jgi:alkylhydroperoxidase family enzyme
VRDYEPLIEALRAAAQPGRPAPEAMASYLGKVHAHAYRVTDADVEQLREEGFSDDEIFEHTVSAAVAEGLTRLDAALKVVG